MQWLNAVPESQGAAKAGNPAASIAKLLGVLRQGGVAQTAAATVTLI